VETLAFNDEKLYLNDQIHKNNVFLRKNSLLVLEKLGGNHFSLNLENLIADNQIENIDEIAKKQAARAATVKSRKKTTSPGDGGTF